MGRQVIRECAQKGVQRAADLMSYEAHMERDNLKRRSDNIMHRWTEDDRSRERLFSRERSTSRDRYPRHITPSSRRRTQARRKLDVNEQDYSSPDSDLSPEKYKPGRELINAASPVSDHEVGSGYIER